MYCGVPTYDWDSKETTCCRISSHQRDGLAFSGKIIEGAIVERTCCKGVLCMTKNLRGDLRKVSSNPIIGNFLASEQPSRSEVVCFCTTLKAATDASVERNR